MKELAPNIFAWLFIFIAVVWIIRQVGASMKLFGLNFSKRFFTIQAGLMILAIAVWFGGVWLSKSLQVDKCLDGGGRWNEESRTCEH